MEKKSQSENIAEGVPLISDYSQEPGELLI